MNIQEKVLQKIHEGNIRPIARWRFLVAEYARWVAAVALIIFSILGLSTLLHVLREGEWDIHTNFGMSFFQYAISVFPYMWLGFLLVIGLLAFLAFRLTRRGYRYTSALVISIGIATVVIFGTIFLFLGAGSLIDETLTTSVPAYQTLPHHNLIIWNHPKEGLLSGTIIHINENNSFELKDFNNKLWTIDETSSTWKQVGLRNQGEKIKIVGTYNADGSFSAFEIRPWQILKPSERIFFPVRTN